MNCYAERAVSGSNKLTSYTCWRRLCRVIDDVSGDCRPDESGSAGHDDAVHEKKLIDI